MRLPEVHARTWSTSRPLALAAWLTEARARTELDGPAFERLLWHGGLHGPTGRVGGGGPMPESIPAGRASAYWFAAEPEPAPLPPGAVLLDTEGVVAVAKPAGLHTQPTRASTRLCLEHAVRACLGDPELRAVHRLDRPTSGVILFARGRETTGQLWRQLASHRMERTYAAVVAPPPAEDAWTVRGILVQRHHPSHAYFELVAQPPPDGTGRASETRFEVVVLRDGYALVRARPRTGRTHQLRVHLAAGGTPVVGDGLYGSGPTPASGGDLIHLHAARLGFRLPASGRRIEVVAPFEGWWPPWAHEAWARAAPESA